MVGSSVPFRILSARCPKLNPTRNTEPPRPLADGVGMCWGFGCGFRVPVEGAGVQPCLDARFQGLGGLRFRVPDLLRFLFPENPIPLN